MGSMDGEVASERIENNNKKLLKMAVDQRDECEMMEVDDGSESNTNNRTENNGTITNNNNAHANNSDSAPSSPPPPAKIARLSKSASSRRSNSTSNNSSSKPSTPSSSSEQETKVNSVSPSHTPNSTNDISVVGTPAINDVVTNGPNHVVCFCFNYYKY